MRSLNLLPCTRAELAVIRERRRQVTEEGWTAEHDATHSDGTMARAAACYALSAAGWARDALAFIWPKTWGADWFKPKDQRKDLVRAAALLIAEIERIDRPAPRITTLRQSNPWQWWWSRDEERYHGGCDSREEALEEAYSCAEPGDTIFILEATKGALSAAMFDDIDERFDCANENLGDPDGDPISADISAAQWNDLDKRLTQAASAWIKDHDLDRLAWSFGQTRNAEAVIVPGADTEADGEAS